MCDTKLAWEIDELNLIITLNGAYPEHFFIIRSEITDISIFIDLLQQNPKAGKHYDIGCSGEGGPVVYHKR